MSNRNTKIKMSQIADIAPSDVTANATNSPSTGQVPSKASGDEWTWIDAGGSGSGEYFEKSINQSSHGFAVGDVIRHNGTNYVKAQADTEANAEVIGIVSENTDTDNFKVRYGGYISGLSGLTAGSVYFLSDTTAGLLTSTEPATEGHITKPLLIAISTTAGYIFNFRGAEIEGIGGTATYSTSFVDGDLSTGVLTVTHNLSFDYPVVVVYNNSNKQVDPDDIEYVDSNSVKVDLSSFGTLSGTWYVRVTGGAWEQSILRDSDNDTTIDVERTTDVDKIYFKTGGTDRALLDSTGLTLENGTNIDEFSTDGTLGDDSDNAVPTEKAVKTYVDTAISGISTDKIEEGDSKVEVVDSGTGYVTFVIDNTEEARLDGSALKIDAINELTGDTGVTIEGVLLKDTGITLVNAIDEFSTDGTLGDDSDTALPTEKAVKTYVDNALSGISADAVKKEITQASHGFAVGDVLKLSGSTYAKAQADSAANSEVVGIVSAVDGSDDFTLTTNGYISGLSSLTAGTVYFLDPDTAGALTSTEPSGEGEISKPLLVATSTTAGYLANFRGVQVTDSTSYYTSFINSDLTAGVLTVTHNLGHKYCQVQVFDNNDKKINPDEIELTGNNDLDIDLTSYGTISGTWRVVVLDVGATISTSLDTSSFNGILSSADDTVQKAMDTIDDHSHTLQEVFDSGQTITVSDNDNQSLTITQSDTTNNPIGVTIDNNGSNHALLITQDAALATGKRALYILSNTAQTDATTMLFRVEQQNASSTAPLAKLENLGSGDILNVFTGGSTALASGKYALYVYSNAAQINSDLVHFKNDNASSTQPVLRITSDASADHTPFLIDIAGIGTGFAVHKKTALTNPATIQIDNYHLWVDNSGRLRIKSSAPTSDTDGTVVGTQS